MSMSLLGRLAREPLFQFVLIGLVASAGIHYWNNDGERYTILMGPAERARIAARYEQQFGQSPSPDQLASLIEQHIREEIDVREALALGLDKDDEIVRRRIAQKYDFLQTDLTAPASAAPGAVAAWYNENQQRYVTPQRVAFSQVYFSADQEGPQAARNRASSVLERLRKTRVTRAAELGDPFPGPADVSDLAPDDAGRLFGESELSEQLFKLPVGQWSGPYRSGYGWHLVLVSTHRAPFLPPLAAIHARVLADYLAEQRAMTNIRSFVALRARYKIIDADEPR